MSHANKHKELSRSYNFINQQKVSETEQITADKCKFLHGEFKTTILRKLSKLQENKNNHVMVEQRN